MLKQIEKFLEITKAAASGVIGVSSAYFLEQYLGENADKELWLILAVTVALFIIISFFNWVITNIIDSSQRLRKILLGKDFLEGLWIQKIATDSLSERPVIYSKVHISYENGHYKVTGESYDKDGKYTATFQSHSSEYANHILEYPFTITTIENTEKKVFGTSKLTFSPTDELSNKYIGIVYSNLREKPVYVTAKKLPKKTTINLNTSEGRTAFENLID